jgi:hypothetical protein
VQNVVQRTRNGQSNAFDHMIFPTAATRLVKMQEKFEAKRRLNRKTMLLLRKDVLISLLKVLTQVHGYVIDTTQKSDVAQDSHVEHVLIRYKNENTTFSVRRKAKKIIFSVPDIMTPSYLYFCAAISFDDQVELELCNGNRCMRSTLVPVDSMLDLLSYHNMAAQQK